MKRILILLTLTLTVLLMCSCNGTKNPTTKEDEQNMFFKKKQVTAFENILIRESGMRVTEEYEIIGKGDYCEISLYQIIFVQNSNEDKRVLMQSTQYDIQDFIKMMNECGFASWNGFEGKHPKNVHDGIMFKLYATINDGDTVSANGSENFPKNYKKFMGEIKSILNSQNVQ